MSNDRIKNLPRIITLREFCEWRGISRDAAYSQIKRGDIPGLLQGGKRKGGHYLIDVDQYLNGMRANSRTHASRNAIADRTNRRRNHHGNQTKTNDNDKGSDSQ